ncbi:Wzz/FepE/Etk N-terminal domain-containing protein [Parafilimonas sp.]|uniref:Wzz/FepE/Etk N-terminal domain-containing protein n=1 Tax=Parafilimonas sp. TaxID=1969739 RepID=UPI003F7E790B
MENNEEVTVKDIFKQIKKIVRFLFSKWLIIAIVGVLSGLIGLIYASIAESEYKARINFVLSTNSSSGGNLMGLANQFGISFGNDNNDVFSGDNIITLMKSRRMVQQALFSKPIESNEILLNILIRNNKLNEAWQKDEKLRKAYPFPDDPLRMTLIQDSLFRTIYNIVQNEMLDVSKPDKAQSIYAVTTTSKNPEFSFYLTKYLVAVTSAFYIDTKTSIAKENLNMLKKEADSLRDVLGSAITAVGAETDQAFNLNPAYQVRRAGAQQNQAKAAALGQAYGQVLQNLELAKITLQKETPLYQVIDEPTLPLEANKPGRLSSIIIGGLIGAFFTVVFLILKKTFNYLQH